MAAPGIHLNEDCDCGKQNCALNNQSKLSNSLKLKAIANLYVVAKVAKAICFIAHRSAMIKPLLLAYFHNFHYLIAITLEKLFLVEILYVNVT